MSTPNPTCPFAGAIVLTGPTASGKTALGVELAERLGAEIVAMDSMTLYRRLDVGTAKPTAEERQRVPHHLIDVLDPWETASVAWWLEQAAQRCLDIQARGKRILFVGGTPLYLKALLYGIFAGPPRDLNLRRQLEEEAASSGGQVLHDRLACLDPATAGRLHPNDLRRIIRALEVAELTDKPISAWQTQWEGETERLQPLGIYWIDHLRPVLHARIDARVLRMFKSGWVDEVRGLLQLPRPLSPEARQAIGYKEILAHLAGTADRETTIQLIQARSRQFAKRQITWFRHLPGCQPITKELTFEGIHLKIE